MMVYLRQRYHLDMQEYRQIYMYFTGTPVKKEDIKMTVIIQANKRRKFTKRNGSELAIKESGRSP